MADLPDGLSLERHHDLGGRAGYVWLRRALLCCVASLPVLGLLNVFGQRPTTTSAASPAADVSVIAPARLRGGLMFQVQVDVTAHRPIKRLQLAFNEDWWDSMTVNSREPEPEEESAKGGRILLTYGELDAGETLRSRINFQVNPNNIGDRSENLTVMDGNAPLVTVHRSLTIFP